MTDILILLIIVCAYALFTVCADKRQLARGDDLLPGLFPMPYNQISSCGAVTDWSCEDPYASTAAPAVNGDSSSGTLNCNDSLAQGTDSASPASTIYEAC